MYILLTLNMNKIIHTLLFTIVNIFIYSCPNNSSNKNNNSSGKDNNTCKYEIYFDKEFLYDKNLVVKNKEIEDCYIAVKNGEKMEKSLYAKGLLENDFLNDSFNTNYIMRIYESDGKLEFAKATKDNIDNDAMYILSSKGGAGLWFVIFRDINNALSLNNSLHIVEPDWFETYINNLLSI